MAQSALYREIVPGFEITDAEIKAKIQSDLPRRVAMLERYKILTDDWRGVMEKHLSSIFAPDSYESMRPYLDVSNNLAKRICRELAVTYKDEPTRTVDPDNHQDQYQEILRGCRFNQKMAQVNYYLNGLNDLIQMTAIFGSSIDKNILFPHEVIVFENTDNPTIIDALAIEDCYVDSNGKERRQYYFWSPTRHFVLSEEFEKMLVSGNDDGLNPYIALNTQNPDKPNFFPFVSLHASERLNRYWDSTTGNDLFEATKKIAMLNTFLDMMFPMQFKQLALQANLDPGTPAPKNNQLKDPLRVYTASGEIQVLDWQSNLTQLTEAVEKKLYQVAGNYGISQENFRLSSAAVSGFARMIAKERLLEIRDEQVKVYRDIEEMEFEATVAANNLYNIGPQFPDTAQVSIDYVEPRQINDPMQELLVIEKKIEMGLTNPLEIVKRENPDLKTDEEAEAYLQKNIETRNRLQQRFTGLVRRPTPTPGPGNDGRNLGS